MKPLDSAEVVFCDNHILVAVKPAGMLSQPDQSHDEDLESLMKEWVKKEYDKKGNVFLHCIHRLDRSVSGLILFARTSKALSRLNEQMREMSIQRIYCAEVEGCLPKGEIRQLDHYLVHADHRALIVKEKTAEAKHARLHFQVLHTKETSTCVMIELKTGRYHQIRAQFSAIGHPVVGDKRYGSKSGSGKEIKLHCSKLSFEHPVTREQLSFESPSPFG